MSKEFEDNPNLEIAFTVPRLGVDVEVRREGVWLGCEKIASSLSEASEALAKVSDALETFAALDRTALPPNNPSGKF